jgi:hypothetical protein
MCSWMREASEAGGSWGGSDTWGGTLEDLAGGCSPQLLSYLLCSVSPGQQQAGAHRLCADPSLSLCPTA